MNMGLDCNRDCRRGAVGLGLVALTVGGLVGGACWGANYKKRAFDASHDLRINDACKAVVSDCVDILGHCESNNFTGHHLNNDCHNIPKFLGSVYGAPDYIGAKDLTPEQKCVGLAIATEGAITNNNPNVTDSFLTGSLVNVTTNFPGNTCTRELYPTSDPNPHFCTLQTHSVNGTRKTPGFITTYTTGVPCPDKDNLKKTPIPQHQSPHYPDKDKEKAYKIEGAIVGATIFGLGLPITGMVLGGFVSWLDRKCGR